MARGRGMMDPMTSYPPGQHPVNAGFAERLLEVIDSGRRTATYKLALLLALLDLYALHADPGHRAEPGQPVKEPPVPA
jgi:hypothetical protein